MQPCVSIKKVFSERRSRRKGPSRLSTKTLRNPNVHSHDDLRFRDGRGDGLVRQHLSPVDVDLVLDDDVLAEHADVLHAPPLAHVAVPADDAGLEPRVRLRHNSIEKI